MTVDLGPSDLAGELPAQWMTAGDCLPLSIRFVGELGGALAEWLFAARSASLILSVANGGLAVGVTTETIEGEEVDVTTLTGEIHTGWTAALGGQRIDHALRLTDGTGHRITLLRGMLFVAHSPFEDG